MAFMARHFGLIFGAIFLVVGLAFLFVGITSWKTERRFATESVTAEGLVLTKNIVRARRNSNSTRYSTRYSTTYRFEVRQGDTVDATDEIDVDVWESLEEQGPVTIEFLRDDPDTSRVAGTNDTVLATVFTGAGGLFSLIGGGVVSFAVRRRREEARLRRDGMHAVGTVVGVEETNVRVNRVSQWRMRYRYRDHRGRDHEGESGLLTPDEAANIRAGDTGPVRYDRRRPERNVWLGPPIG